MIQTSPNVCVPDRERLDQSNASRRVFGWVVAALLLAATSAPAQTLDTKSNAVAAFVEGCLNRAPGFRGAGEVFKRRGIAIYPAEAIMGDRIPVFLPPAIAASLEGSGKGAICIVFIRGNADEIGTATVRKYLTDPKFPFKGSIEENIVFGTKSERAGIVGKFPLGSGRLLGILVTKGIRLGDIGRGTMLVAMSGKGKFP